MRGLTDDDDDALLDRGQIAELRQVFDAVQWIDLIETFAESAHDELAALHDALAAGRSHAAPAHALKGMALNVGARRVGAIGRALEAASPAEVPRLCAAIEGAIAETLRAMLADVTVPEPEPCGV